MKNKIFNNEIKVNFNQFGPHIRRYSDDLYKLIYGDDVDIDKLLQENPPRNVIYDIVLFLAKDDPTKIEEIKKMKIIDIFELLSAKLRPVPRIKYIHKTVGFKNNEPSTGI